MLVTAAVSLLTAPKPVSELKGLVYGATEIPSEQEVALYLRPAFWAVIVAVVLVILNILFW
jgi:SSS family solute:Na+ symporter